MNKDKRIFAFFLIFFLVFPAYFLSRRLSLFYSFLSLDDSISSLFYRASPPPSLPVVLVAIDDYSLSRMKQRWPWPRSVYADLLRRLSRAGAKVAAFDLIFSGRGVSASDDLEFSQALRESKTKVLLAYSLDKKGKKILPLKEFGSAACLAPINTPLDLDGKVRKIKVLQREGKGGDYAFGLKTYLLFSSAPARIYGSRLLLGRRIIPLGRKNEIMLNFLIKPSDVSTFSFYSVWKGKIGPDAFKNKAVFIAPLAAIMHDKVNTPLGEMPGVFVHINAFYQFLSGRFLHMSFILEAVLLVLSLLVTAAAVYYFGLLLNFLVLVSILVLLFWVDVFLGFWGVRFSWAAVAVFSFIYWALANILKYIYTLSALLKMKNKAVKDPLTGLNSLRYFYYLASFRCEHIRFNRKYCLAGFYLRGMKASGRDISFSRLREIWQGISDYLKGKGIWARLEEEIIIGVLPAKKSGFREELEQIKSYLEEICGSLGLPKAEVKAAFVVLSRSSDIVFLSKKIAAELKKEGGGILCLKEAKKARYIPASRQDSLEIIDKDIESKNLHLLAALEKLEAEKRKAEEAYLEVITSLVNALEEKDPYTQGHTKRVCDYAVMLAEYLKLPPEEVENVRKAALLHDIGKIGIPDSILNKKGALSDEEFTIIKQHTVMGVKILEPIKHLKPVINYILYHHERFDGRGYPHGLAGDMIPQGAQIIAIADSFDAITSGRSYKGGMSFQTAAEKLKEARGTQFSPLLVDKFIEALAQKGFLS